MTNTRLPAVILILVCCAPLVLAQKRINPATVGTHAETATAQVTHQLLRNLSYIKAPRQRVVSRGQVAVADSLTGAISGLVSGFDMVFGEEIRVWAFSIDSTRADSVIAASNYVKDDGFYLISDLAPGSYVVAARADGLETQFYDHVSDASLATPVEVQAGATTPDVNFDLEPWSAGEGVISGKVVDRETGEAIAHAEIVAIPGNAGFWWGTGESDDSGNYIISGLPSGKYFVEARADGYLIQLFDGVERFRDATPVRVSEPDTTKDVNFAMEIGGSITGLVEDEAGHPVEGVWVYATQWDVWPPDGGGIVDLPSGFSGGVTDSDGIYSLEGLDEGSFVVSATLSMPFYSYQVYFDGARLFTDATPVDVKRGEVTANIDFQVSQPEGLGSISGTVVGQEGEQIVEGLVWIFSTRSWGWLPPADSLGLPGDPFGVPDIAVPVPIGPDGAYVFEFLPPGDYLVAVELFDAQSPLFVWYPSTIFRDNAKLVTVAADSATADIDIRIPTFDGVIKGRILTQDGKPIPDATVAVQQDHFLSAIRQFASTDTAGYYQLAGLPDGEYNLSAFSCTVNSCVTRWWPDAEVPSDAEPISIVDGVASVEAVDFVLPLRIGSGMISGRTTDSFGNPLHGAFVSVFTSDPTLSEGFGGWASSDSTGMYVIKNIFEGSYYIQASYYAPDSIGFGWYENVSTMEEATPVAVQVDQKVDDIDFALTVRPIFGRIRGRVVDAETGASIDRGYIQVVSPYLDLAYRYAPFLHEPGMLFTDGEFELDHLYEGEYAIAAFVEDGHVWYPEGQKMDEAERVAIVAGGVVDITIRVPVRKESAGRIEGRVRSEDNGPIDIAVVSAIAVESDSKRAYTSISDPDGVYSIDGLPDDGYIVQARAPYHAPQYFDNTFDPSKATVLQVAGGASSGIDITLSPVYYAMDEGSRAFGQSPGAGAIAGMVSEVGGQPVGGATVYVLQDDGQVVAFGETASDGSFRIEGLIPNGAYRLQVGMPGFEGQFNGGVSDLSSAAPISWEGATAEVNFVLDTLAPTANGDQDYPMEFRLTGNYPNPFNPTTTINFTLAEAREVAVQIFDVLGREISRIDLGLLQKGPQSVRWGAGMADGYQLPSGIYLYNVTAGEWQASGRMVLSR